MKHEPSFYMVAYCPQHPDTAFSVCLTPSETADLRIGAPMGNLALRVPMEFWTFWERMEVYTDEHLVCGIVRFAGLWTKAPIVDCTKCGKPYVSALPHTCLEGAMLARQDR